MWLILKNKSNELNLALSELTKINLRDHYIAKTKINKKLKNVLLNYFFLKIDPKTNLLNKIKYTKGVHQVLEDSIHHQKVINQFIDFCKTHEDQDGFLTREFFLKFLKTKGQFTSGPFKNIFFEVLDKNDKELKVLLDNYKHPIVINNDNKDIGINFI